jgi:hypothetical protein
MGSKELLVKAEAFLIWRIEKDCGTLFSDFMAVFGVAFSAADMWFSVSSFNYNKIRD